MDAVEPVVPEVEAVDGFVTDVDVVDAEEVAWGQFDLCQMDLL